MNASSSTLIRPVAFPAIDGIRFYAAMAVFVQHVLGGIALEYFLVPAAEFNYRSESALLRFFYYLSDGNHGVDVFFIISGFLMSRIVLNDSRQFSYQNFLGNRIKRIYPAFLASLVVTTAVVVLVFNWPWSPIMFLKNMIFLNALPSLGVLPYNHVSWSLGYEFAFYLVIPVLLVMSKFVDARVAAAVLLMISLACVPTEVIRINGLFVGALIGAFSNAKLERFAKRIPLAALLVIYLLCGVLKATIPLSFGAYYYWFLAAAALLFIKLTWCNTNKLSLFFSSPSLRKLGALSYSIYLFHSVIGSVVMHKLTPWKPSILGAAWIFSVTLLLTLAASYVSYAIFERWYFNRGRHPKIASLRESTT